MSIQDIVDEAASRYGFEKTKGPRGMLVYYRTNPDDSASIPIDVAELKQCEGGEELARWLEKKFHQGH